MISDHLEQPTAYLCRTGRSLDDALNAFGLFARATTTMPLDNAMAMPMLIEWGISNIE